MSQLSVEDRWDIHQALSYYGHVADNAEWDKLDQIFTAEVSLESGLVIFHGISGVKAFEQQSFPVDALAHHVVNTVIRDGGSPGTAAAWSRFVLVTYEGTVLGGDYVDSFVRVDGQWRIPARRVSERNRSRPEGPTRWTAPKTSPAGGQNRERCASACPCPRTGCRCGRDP